MHLIKLQSSDGQEFVCDLRAAKRSNVIKNMLEVILINLNFKNYLKFLKVLNIEDNTQDVVVPIPVATSDILQKIVDFCHRHIDDPELNSSEDEMEFAERDMEEFRQYDVATIFELIKASDHLDIPDLQSVGCKAVANLISGKSPEEIRQLFNINNDFTPEEEAQVRRENQEREEARAHGRIAIRFRRE
jgi:S-phase kinase-associated protein 1